MITEQSKHLDTAWIWAPIVLRLKILYHTRQFHEAYPVEGHCWYVVTEEQAVIVEIFR